MKTFAIVSWLASRVVTLVTADSKCFQELKFKRSCSQNIYNFANKCMPSAVHKNDQGEEKLHNYQNKTLPPCPSYPQVVNAAFAFRIVALTTAPIIHILPKLRAKTVQFSNCFNKEYLHDMQTVLKDQHHPPEQERWNCLYRPLHQNPCTNEPSELETSRLSNLVRIHVIGGMTCFRMCGPHRMSLLQTSSYWPCLPQSQFNTYNEVAREITRRKTKESQAKSVISLGIGKSYHSHTYFAVEWVCVQLSSRKRYLQHNQCRRLVAVAPAVVDSCSGKAQGMA